MGTDMEYRGHTVHKDTDLAEDMVAHNGDNVASRNMGNGIQVPRFLLHNGQHYRKLGNNRWYGYSLKHPRNPTAITCP